MGKSVKKSLAEKEIDLIEKLEKAKTNLQSLRQRRARECGDLLVKLGLSQLDDKILLPALEKLAKQLIPGEHDDKPAEG